MQLDLMQTWTVGDRIGEGGFGRVYAVTAGARSAVAKLIPKAPGAERELLFLDLPGVRNVVPIIDSGETADHWVLVMPRAEKSLRQLLDEANGPLAPPDSLTILSDVAETLNDLAPRVVHQDLKPENVLQLDGKWCLADFGISRYADAATAPNTQKYAWSLPYAAPERWRGIRASTATDIYSLGVIAYELLAAALPFPGPRVHDFRDQHLHSSPHPLTSVSPALVTLVEECLYKPPEARPSPCQVLTRLRRLRESAPSPGLEALQAANRVEVARRSEDARLESERQSEAAHGKALFDSGLRAFERIRRTLRDALLEAAPSARLWDQAHVGWSIRLKDASLRFSEAKRVAANSWDSHDHPGFAVVAVAKLSVVAARRRSRYEGRSHSLWYCDAQQAEQYGWFETAFMDHPIRRIHSSMAPFALQPGRRAGEALRSSLV
ncbi:serine/threonine-protein kinase [Candidatus Palauibacter sp.]|uniref:serine/threonine-protein kinase n=1 Tax=Candidatus Palauibacter sp. TaxID=3101350 RepID=UPI003CC61908